MRVKSESVCAYIGVFEGAVASRTGMLHLKNDDFAEVLGCTSSAFNMYRSCKRKLPEYHKRHMAVILMLSDSKLKGLFTNGK